MVYTAAVRAHCYQQFLSCQYLPIMSALAIANTSLLYTLLIIWKGRGPQQKWQGSRSSNLACLLQQCHHWPWPIVPLGLAAGHYATLLLASF